MLQCAVGMPSGPEALSGAALPRACRASSEAHWWCLQRRRVLGALCVAEVGFRGRWEKCVFEKSCRLIGVKMALSSLFRTSVGVRVALGVPLALAQRNQRQKPSIDRVASSTLWRRCLRAALAVSRERRFPEVAVCQDRRSPDEVEGGLGNFVVPGQLLVCHRARGSSSSRLDAAAGQSGRWLRHAGGRSLGATTAGDGG